jgi:hypothetical protein
MWHLPPATLDMGLWQKGHKGLLKKDPASHVIAMVEGIPLL